MRRVKGRHTPFVRPARIWVTVLIVTGALIAGGGGGFWIARQAGAVGNGALTPTTGDEQQLYTCGMHPNVIQKGPGECPICHMKLTPLKQAIGAEGTSAAAGPQERKILYWRAPMDPSYISDKPGKSPMGMDLVPVYAEESVAGPQITIDPATIQNMGIRTTLVRRGPLVKTIRTVGRVDYDEEGVTFIDTKFEGWIERLHVDETGMQVNRGDALFEVYSPKLYSAQEEYLAALRGVERLSESTMPEAREQAERLVEAAEVQLKYFDISDAQIDELRRTREIRKTLTINSPASGIVTEKMALEGMYVKPGMRLYTLADLSTVWVYVDVYEYQLPWVRIGQPATMTLPYLPGRFYEGEAVYIYPYLEEKTRVVHVRLEFPNPELALKPGMYATVTLKSQIGREAVLVPREAYIDSGIRQVAFLALPGGKFQPRDIGVGVEAEDGMVEVRQGLEPGDRVVVSGQFLLDAESKLKEAIEKMLSAKQAPMQDNAAELPSSSPMDHGTHETTPEQAAGLQIMNPDTLTPADASMKGD
ncbi:MAG: efflux RND transporter periplasmic adaptor subunit [Phycisphaerae bacterium]|nr:efflux RND transporter periplasmic adaptor subunit [Phycisphaerae bacterium]